MRKADIGDEFVMRDGQQYGIVTDRDMVLRGLATGRDPRAMAWSPVCSEGFTCV
jgi:CBS domain-containing protein